MDEHIKLFETWLGNLVEGSEARKESREMRKIIAGHFDLHEKSELVMACWAFCAGAKAATEHQQQGRG